MSTDRAAQIAALRRRINRLSLEPEDALTNIAVFEDIFECAIAYCRELLRTDAEWREVILTKSAQLRGVTPSLTIYANTLACYFGRL